MWLFSEVFLASLNRDVLEPKPTGLGVDAIPDDFVRLAVRLPDVVVRLLLLQGRKELDRRWVGLGLDGGDTSEPLEEMDSSSSDPLLPRSILFPLLILTFGRGLGDCLL